MKDLDDGPDFASESIKIELETHFNMVQDGQFVLDAIDMADNIACGAKQAYPQEIAVSGTSTF